VVGGAHQHCLLFESDTFLSVRKYLLADGRNLGILVGASDEAGTPSGLSIRGLEHSGEPLWSLSSHGICDVKDVLARSVVGLQDDGARSRKDSFEMQDVTRFSRPERLDRLCVVSDNRDSFVGSTQCLQNIHLQSVHVLIFINQYVVERTSKPRAQPIIEGGGPPE
jgi:hypothetical protein